MDSYQAFLEAWHRNMYTGAVIAFVIGVLIHLIYHLRVALIRDFKKKHDFINRNEIRLFKYSFYAFGLCTAFLINTYGKDKFEQFGVWFYVRIFFSVAGATLVGYIAALILDFYWPTKL